MQGIREFDRILRHCCDHSTAFFAILLVFLGDCWDSQTRSASLSVQADLGSVWKRRRRIWRGGRTGHEWRPEGWRSSFPLAPGLMLARRLLLQKRRCSRAERRSPTRGPQDVFLYVCTGSRLEGRRESVGRATGACQRLIVVYGARGGWQLGNKGVEDAIATAVRRSLCFFEWLRKGTGRITRSGNGDE